ncbi:MAG: protein kinase [candidate division Zixibacteria bacterium]|nr:protein kinase [candidate division Zixibacteria bacterium]
MIGDIMSHYKILEKLGSGGMGEVYLAEDTRLRRRVALKFLPSQYTSEPELKARFMREAQAAAALNHPNIITVHEVAEYKDKLYIAMEYVEGESLKDLIARKELSIGQVLDVALQISDGLSAAHQVGIVHRDIKPQNILMGKDNRIRICDFGLAKAKRDVTLTQAGSTLGTVAYMSPEQAQGMEVDQRSDIFSFGVILYEMITGQLPFKGEYEAAVIHSIINETPEPLARYKPNVPEGLQRVVEKATEKNSEMRYQHVDDLGADLRKLKKELEFVKEQPSAKRRQPSIAVLPFTNLSADPEQEYFCDGMAEEIINALTHVEGLRVVARTSAFSFRGKEVDIREIGHKLNVETLLEGSVRKAGNRVRITAQLVNVADGYHLWSEKYDRDMEDIFAIQDEISLAIVDKSKVHLLGEEKSKIVKRHTGDLEAHNLYLKGIYFLRMYTADGFNRAIEYFEHSLQKDPDYALAYYGLAEVFYAISFWGNVPPNDAYPKAKEHAKKALEIDDTLGEAHAALGLVYTFYDWRWKSAERELNQALKLHPNSAIIHMSHSWFLTLTERHEKAVIEAKYAQDLDPLSGLISAHVGLACIWGSQYDKAIEELQMTLTLTPGFYLAHYYLGLAYRAKSMIEEAIEEFEKAVDLGTGTPWPAMILATNYFESGKNAQGEKLLKSLKQRLRHEYMPSLGFFYIHLVRGELELALDWLERACKERDSFLPWSRIIPIDSYRIPDEPKFRALLQEAGLDA